MATKIITRLATPPAESTGSDYNKGDALTATEFDQNFVNLRAAVDRALIKFYLPDTTYAPATQVLPADGLVVIKKAVTSPSDNAITVEPGVGGQTIDGESSLEFSTPGEAKVLLLVDTNWEIIL